MLRCGWMIRYLPEIIANVCASSRMVSSMTA
jgi:hypothetical protein